ncbi:helix-turn-helix domain-containing protein [Streptomyces sp. NPDC020755]|uniref:helix-turn-helix domain-containing protein n=1 Tax=unclassified Streptomyces TaxID=2593676 RepID=UPI00224298D1|nr:transcriptional regulator [Streptomyces sp. VB1]UZI26904.1 helix-turn-helix domain-containing protein [Streptomyces sp. VB1]
MSGDAEGAARAVLAERLSALRERSGRTYASLARRIGVSGSTLHRYCTGRTVPAEFAPVERLARLCGAPAGEREALHRLWILADRERLDRQGAAQGKPEEKADAETGAEAAPTEVVPVDGSAGETVSPRRWAALPHAAAAGPSGAAVSGPPPSAAHEPSGRTGPRPGPAPVAGEAATIGSGTPRGPVSRSRRARRYGQGLGVLAAAVLALTLVAALGGTSLPGPDRRPSVAQRPGGPPADSPEPSPSASRTPGKPQGSPSGTPRGTPSGSTRPATVPPGVEQRGEALPRTSGGSPGPKAGRVPFTWTADGHVWKNGCDHSYLVDRAPAAVPPPPVEADAESWAGALGAVHAGEAGVRITLQGKDERAVVLEALRIRVVERRSPAEGRVYRMSSGCGGALTPRMFDVDLDAPRPVARSVAGNDSGEPIEAVAFPYSVSVTDPEVLLITGRTVGCDCDWFAELTWSAGGRSGTVRVDDGGRPFRTSGVRGRPVLDYDTVTGRWVSVPEAGEATS